MTGLLDALLVAVGLVGLVAGGELLVRGASALARRFGMPPLLVGLTVVSLATGSPELAVTLDAVLRQETELALGNVVGSNIANVLLALGATALVSRVAVQRRLLVLDLPAAVVLSGLTWVLALDGTIDRVDGLALFALLALHLALSVRIERRRQPAADADPHPVADAAPQPRLPLSLLQIVGGVAALVLGANALVAGASGIARALGVGGLVIGLTVVAVGTSLPELVASVIAARRGETGLAVGNVLGSNIVNLGLVLALPATLTPAGLPVPGEMLRLDLPLMLVSMVLLVPLALTGRMLTRREGVALLALYLLFVNYVVLVAVQHAALGVYTMITLAVVLPAMALGLLLSWRRQGHSLLR